MTAFSLSPFRLSMPALIAVLVAIASPSQASEALAKKHGCLGCHAVASASVGPAYKDVAAKYADDKDAAAALALRIRAGGGGTWGEMDMPPQPQVTPAEAKRLATWILGGAR